MKFILKSVHDKPMDIVDTIKYKVSKEVIGSFKIDVIELNSLEEFMEFVKDYRHPSFGGIIVSPKYSNEPYPEILIHNYYIY